MKFCFFLFVFFLFILFLHPFTFIVFHCFIYDSVFSYLLFITYIVWVNLFFPLNSSFNKQLKSSILRINVDYMLDFIVPFFLSLNILMIMMNNQNSILTIYYKFFFVYIRKALDVTKIALYNCYAQFSNIFLFKSSSLVSLGL